MEKIIGTGVDIVKISRFEKYVSNPDSRFITRVYTQSERSYLKGRKAQSYAGIFAAKEAVAKAFGTGFSGFFPGDIEILHDERGKPRVVLHGRACPGLGCRVEISISHTYSDAVAFAVIIMLTNLNNFTYNASID